MGSVDSSARAMGCAFMSRRGWNMTALLPELERLPEDLILDGELVAFNDAARQLPLVCDRLLHGSGTSRSST